MLLKSSILLTTPCILLRKLEHYGIRGIPLAWFTSYLHNGYQFIYANDKISNLLPVTSGMPQGSLLGTVLFTLFINDLVNSSEVIIFVMYADDTTPFLSDASLVNLFFKANAELLKVSAWFLDNRLSINITKTKLFSIYKYCLS